MDPKKISTIIVTPQGTIVRYFDANNKLIEKKYMLTKYDEMYDYYYDSNGNKQQRGFRD